MLIPISFDCLQLLSLAAFHIMYSFLVTFSSSYYMSAAVTTGVGLQPEAPPTCCTSCTGGSGPSRTSTCSWSTCACCFSTCGKPCACSTGAFVTHGCRACASSSSTHGCSACASNLACAKRCYTACPGLPRDVFVITMCKPKISIRCVVSCEVQRDLGACLISCSHLKTGSGIITMCYNVPCVVSQLLVRIVLLAGVYTLFLCTTAYMRHMGGHVFVFMCLCSCA